MDSEEGKKQNTETFIQHGRTGAESVADGDGVGRSSRLTKACAADETKWPTVSRSRGIDRAPRRSTLRHVARGRPGMAKGITGRPAVPSKCPNNLVGGKKMPSLTF